MKKTLFSVAIIATNFAFAQLNVFENFDSSTNSPTGFSGAGISTDPVYACSLNNSLATAAVFVPKTIIYQSPNVITTDKDIVFKFNHNYMKSGAGMMLEISYKLLRPNGLAYYEDTLPTISIGGFGVPGQSTSCTQYLSAISKSKITVANSAIKITLKLTPAVDATTLNYIWIDNFSLSQTSPLNTEEIQSKSKLSAFPNPTNKILNIINPQNETNKIEIYDTSGKLILSKMFNSSDNKISVDVEHLPKGNYIYKIGDLSSKFIKN